MSRELTDEELRRLLRQMDDVPPAPPDFFDRLRATIETTSRTLADTPSPVARRRRALLRPLSVALILGCLAGAIAVAILRDRASGGSSGSAACGLALTFNRAVYLGQHVVVSETRLGPSIGTARRPACADGGEPVGGAAAISVRRIRGIDPLVELAVASGQSAGVYVHRGFYPQAASYPVRMPDQGTGHGCTLGSRFSFVGRVASLGYTYPYVRVIRMVSGKAFRPADGTPLYVSPKTDFASSARYRGAGRLRVGETIRVAAIGCQVPGAALPRPIPLRIEPAR
jgi:hypothetical protein